MDRKGRHRPQPVPLRQVGVCEEPGPHRGEQTPATSTASSKISTASSTTWPRSPEVTDTTLLIHPTLFPDFLDFNDVHQIADEAVAEHDLEA